MYIRFLAVPWYGFIALSGIAAAQNTLSYDSAYADYRPYREETKASWRQANDDAARVGGHAGIFAGGTPHAHGATQAPGTPAAAPPAGSAAPDTPPAAHRGHH